MELLSKEQTIKKETVVTVGKFDGLHLGHQSLFAHLKKHPELSSVVFMFWPEDEKERIYTKDESLHIIEKIGVDYVYIQGYDHSFLKITREDFLLMLKHKYNMQRLVVGDDFRFGYKALGNVEYLLSVCGDMGFAVDVVPSEYYKSGKISSTRIRNAISKGEVDEVADMLGRYYSASGTVVHGKELGRTISFPTANIFSDKLKPLNGVYASVTTIGKERYNGITNVGMRPTVEDSEQINIETNIFDFDRDIYGHDITVEFLKKIRGEIKFKSTDALARQIAEDSEKVKKFFLENGLQT